MASSELECIASQPVSPLPSHLIDGKEVYGPLGSIEPVDNETIAVKIGKRSVLLPASLELPVASRIFVARLDNEYVVRRAEG